MFGQLPASAWRSFCQLEPRCSNSWPITLQDCVLCVGSFACHCSAFPNPELPQWFSPEIQIPKSFPYTAKSAAITIFPPSLLIVFIWKQTQQSPRAILLISLPRPAATSWGLLLPETMRALNRLENQAQQESCRALKGESEEYSARAWHKHLIGS